MSARGALDRDVFVEARKLRWERLESLIRVGPAEAAEWSELAASYRSLCADLALAQSQQLPADVQAYLDELASRAHNQLYGTRPGEGLWLPTLVGREFPREVRAQWRLFLAANLLFYGPFLVGMIGALLDPGFALAVLPEEALGQMEKMYSTPEMVREGTGMDTAMAGFYVYNNVGIAFRCFATGALAGLGSVFYMAYNGLMMGTVTGYLTSVGYGGNLLNFTAGHTAWELTGIVVAGTAGLRMGWAMVVTEGRTRLGSIRAAAPSLYRLVAGATALLLVAAAIEGFWSASPVPPPVKWAFGALQVVIVASWLAFGGRE